MSCAPNKLLIGQDSNPPQLIIGLFLWIGKVETRKQIPELFPDPIFLDSQGEFETFLLCGEN